MNICEHLTATAKRFPEKTAIVFGGHSFTYQQLEQMSAQAAFLLRQAGVSRGDRVALMLPNVPAFVVWYYASLRLGAITVSISTRLTEKEVAFVVSDCEATTFVAETEALAKQRQYLPDCVANTFAVSVLADQCNGENLGGSGGEGINTWIDAEPDEAALILYTSGTTGFAKGATLSQNNVRSNVLEFNRLCDMQSEDCILLAVPLFHCFGQNALLNSALNVGATLVLQRGFDINESKRLIQEQQVTQLYGVPTMFQLFAESCTPADFESVRYCFSAAAKLPIQVSRQWQEKFGQPIFEGYGLTETSPFASYNHLDQYVMGSIGAPIDQVEMKIVDAETGEICPPGELGEIAIRGPNVMLGYWNRPEETANVIRDGWFHSGDIGRQDERGLFSIVDRVKDMIAVGGLKVYPAEVERVLLDHESVCQAAVVGFPDEVFGERVVAFVVVAKQAATDLADHQERLQQHCRENLASYKVPRQFVPINELPRNPSGKVLKTKLREFDLSREMSAAETSADELAAHLPASAAPTREPTLWQDLQKSYATNRLQVATAYIQNTVQVLSGEDEPLEPDARFLEAGLDSLMIVEMSSQIQAEVGTTYEIPATLLFDYPCVSDLAAFLVQTFEADQQPSKQPEPDHPEALPAAKTELVALQNEVAAMSEDEALQELMRELESS